MKLSSIVGRTCHLGEHLALSEKSTAGMSYAQPPPCSYTYRKPQIQALSYVWNTFPISLVHHSAFPKNSANRTTNLLGHKNGTFLELRFSLWLPAISLVTFRTTVPPRPYCSRCRGAKDGNTGKGTPTSSLPPVDDLPQRKNLALSPDESVPAAWTNASLAHAFLCEPLTSAFSHQEEILCHIQFIVIKHVRMW